MPTQKNHARYANSEEMVAIREALEQMEENLTYNTQSSFSPNIDKYPDSKIPFVDKHMSYLMSHKNVDPKTYISNLRLMTKIR